MTDQAERPAGTDPAPTGSLPGYLFRALAMTIVTVAFSVAGLGVALTGGGRRFTKVAAVWGRALTWLCGVKVVAEGTHGPFDAPAYVVMANHSSHFDVISIYACFPFDIRPVAKRELGYIPVFGWVLRAGAAIMIDRGNRKRATASIERAGQTIRGGRSVLMFPEGTRTPAGIVGDLKKGPFHLALTAGVPVLPVGVEGAGLILPPGDWRIRPGTVRVRIGTPISTEGLRNTPEHRAYVSRQVRTALADLSRSSLDPSAQAETEPKSGDAPP